MKSLVVFAFVVASGSVWALEQVNGTTGTPLGGFGAGAVKFDANTGSFAAMLRPPADAYDFERLKNARIKLAIDRAGATTAVDTLKARLVDGKPDDDAIWPLHRVNFGATAGVALALTAFSPFDRQDPARMSLPYAFYEFTVTNQGTNAAQATLGFGLDDGLAVTPIAGKGFTSKAWSVFADGGTVASSAATTTVTVSLGPKESRRVRFVLAWYEDSDPQRSWYHGRHRDSGSVAEAGLASFATLKENAEQLVHRMRGSNLPDWLTNQTLNTLVNLSTNSMYKVDGRIAFAEGQWTCFGTMDQMWHARQIVAQLLPFFAWEELRYWARTQMKNGQIHHDTNKMDVGADRALRSLMVDWDDTEHTDYRNIDKWVDLNAGFIISAYETYVATGNRERFDALWPNVKRAAQRILDQVAQYGNRQYPYTFDHSENSYDAGGDPNPFNASLSAVAYKLMVQLAQERGEQELAARYQTAYDTVVASFRARYLNEGGFKLGKHSEGYYGGQWLALHMKLGELWPRSDTDFVLDRLNDYYQPYYRGLGYPDGTYDEWTPYILVHYGGLLLGTRRANEWAVMQKDAYERQYLDRNHVFNHPLNILPKVSKPAPSAHDVRSKKQYISMPGLWRNYYDIVGYHRDARTQALWLTPIFLPELKGRMTNAPYFAPEGDGTISVTQSARRRQLLFKPDQPLRVGTLHLADDFGASVSIAINGRKHAFTRAGSGYAKELLVPLNATVGKEGLTIDVSGAPGEAPPPLPAKSSRPAPVDSRSLIKLDPFKGMEADKAGKSAGTTVEVDTTGRAYVASVNNFDWIQFARVDFGDQGATRFSAVLNGLADGANIDIVLDDVAGDVAGSLTVPRNDAGQSWVTLSTPVKKITGVRNVILRFYGSSQDNLMTIDKVKFE